MKRKISCILSIFISILILASCEKKDNNKTTPTTQTGPIITEIDSEVAIDNFLDKLEEYNYKIEGENFLTISVYSEELIYFNYEAYADEVYMTVNEDETFTGIIKNGGVDNIEFYDEGVATDVLYSKLPNSWIDESEGNIWNILTNFPEDPLNFTIIKDSFIVEQVGSVLLGLGQTALSGIRDMNLILDSEDPKTATIKVKYLDNGQLSPTEQTKEVVITFDIKRPDRLPSDEWVNDPNRAYPAAQTAWNESDIVGFKAIFDQEYDVDELMPFPSFATYAFKRNEEAVYYQGIIYIRDKLATLQEMTDYTHALEDEYGFELSTERFIDGTQRFAFHKQIKDFGNGYYAYSSIYLEYDEGVTIITRKYYNHKDYDDLAAINSVITSYNFPMIASSNKMTGVTGSDYTYEYIESWASLFNYDIVIEVTIAFEEDFIVDQYLDYYISSLTNLNYKYEEAKSLCRYTSEEYQNTFIFNVDNNKNLLHMQFKSERFLTDTEISSALTDSGFPALDLSDINSTSKRVTQMYKVLYNQTHKNVYIVTLSFDTVDELNSFLDYYIDNTLLNNGFDKVSPYYARVQHKDLAYYNETKKLILCFNYTGLSTVSLHFIETLDDFVPDINVE